MRVQRIQACQEKSQPCSRICSVEEKLSQNSSELELFSNAAKNFRLYSLLTFFFIGIPVYSSASGNSLSGIAKVIDGDTVKISGIRIRLFGIDSPEKGQICRKSDGEYNCGKQATAALSKKIFGSKIYCFKKDIDRYGRIVGICRLNEIDLNAWMVRGGWALAYRRYTNKYTEEENLARNAKVGIWQGQFEKPWEWRRGQKKTGFRKVRGECVIKGNINRSGRKIYHIPGGHYYNRTKISTARGERWFCSEAQARKAGWSKAKR